MKRDEIKLSREQRLAVDFEGKDLLVSAAAGSGKTAVLVERILHRLLGCPDKNGMRTREPARIDSFLIVTFTRAAAAQMKEKIADKLDLLLRGGELDEEMRRHIEQQAILVHQARISTLHGFCSSVIREHFQEIDIDVSYRMGDETEMLLMKNDILEEVFEEAYSKAREEGDGEFYRFVENYCTGKNDNVLEDIILELYDKVMSHPWPVEWLEENLSAKNPSSFIRLMLFHTASFIEPMYKSCKRALALCADVSEYEAAVSDDKNSLFEPLMKSLEDLEGEETREIYEVMQRTICNHSWEKLGRKKKDTNEEKAARIKALRDSYKEQTAKLREQFFSKKYEEILKEQERERALLSVLKELLIKFMDSFSEEKRKKRIVDFNDLEHFALEILVDKKFGGIPSAAAMEYRDSFCEIMVDEYQDSNEIQEVILKSVSKNNLFMVGDVKQSIYRFRMARPELFEEKHGSFLPLGEEEKTDSIAEASGCLVELSNNYRSRNLVLDSINEIFRGIMEKKVGNIDYTEKVQLNYKGREFKEYKEFAGKTECIIGNCGSEDVTVEMEAHLTAQRIKKMIEDGETIVDEKTGDFRPVMLSDIVILLRSMKDVSNVFVKVLNQYGIEAVCETTEGYFQTEEVKTACNFLKVIDNPRQDIPLTAVMLSPVFDFSEQELALIKISAGDTAWYDAVEAYGREGEDEALRKKCGEFTGKLNEWRQKSLYMTVSELLSYLLTDSGYMDIMTVKDGGKQRRENLKLLVEKAGDFEKTSFYGLFHFNRYIEKILTYEVDYGEAASGKNYENTVTIMSIHKSKGLEFPVVFVSCMGKQFNHNEVRSPILFHSDLGLGTDCLDEGTRLRRVTQKKQLMKSVIKAEGMGEEIRILYVALTRAKERLILTGCGKDIYRKTEKWSMAGEALRDENAGLIGVLPYYDRIYAGSRLDMVMPVLYAMKGLAGELVRDSKTDCLNIGKDDELDESLLTDLNFELKNFVVTYTGIKKVISGEEERQETSCTRMEELLELRDRIEPDEAEKERLAKLLYLPENEFAGLSGKVSVTEIKRMRTVREEIISDFSPSSPEPPIPAFAGGKRELSSADSGTAFHKLMQYMDYGRLGAGSTKEEIFGFIEELWAAGRLTDEEKELFLSGFKGRGEGWKKIKKFLGSALAARMKAAAEHDRLYREYPFVLGVPADLVYPQLSGKSEKTPLILVQGIIDAFFYEDGEVVLVDYKTDRADPRENGEDLVRKYRVQMEYYTRAIERALGKKPKEVLLYSFGLDRELEMKTADFASNR